MYRTVLRPISACLIVLLLAACSNGIPELPSLQVPDVQTTVDGDGTAYGVAFLMVDSTAPLATASALQSAASQLSEDNFSTQALAEVDDGIYLGMVTDVDSSGNTTLTLPDPDDIPSGTMINASNAFLNATSAVDCSVNANPASVQMTVNMFDLLSVPGYVGLVITPSFSSPVALALMSDQFVDFDALPDNFLAYQWIYSEGETVVSFEGVGCTTFSASGVEFQEGWNLVGWDVDYLAGTAELVNVDVPETMFLTFEGEDPAP